ncbi:SDR family oxidoreductase [Microbacterium jejuense]|uniref:SDR family oxidoreductase n=1 Tax=Microbacterium jejuense TaxID=1263637 RepID=A0ABS7HR57_9MICO|nr:SDR family oxidoreductase [Microbacterium jejuense]MBW9095446.1 SDR family oxidoreductase [Microbacterium jejuense]
MPIALPDLTGRTAVVTGASDGVGLEIARGLAGAGADVVVPVRNRAKGEQAIARIREGRPDARLTLRDLDLARLDSAGALADALRSERMPVDILVLNAGIVLLGDRQRHVTEDGFELHFQTNFLGHFALTTALLPLLRERRARVVVQCSIAAAVSRLDWRDLQGERRYRPLWAYGASKAALGLFACELARRSAAGAWGVSVQLSQPGIVPGTAIAPALRARIGAGVQNAVARLVRNPPADAALPALVAATAAATPGADLFGPSGSFHRRSAVTRRRPYRSVSDPVDGERVWTTAELLLAERIRPA